MKPIVTMIQCIHCGGIYSDASLELCPFCVSEANVVEITPATRWSQEKWDNLTFEECF